MMLIITVLFLCYAEIIHSEESKTRIANNGEVATEGEFPYQVSIKLNGRHFCGGSLISKRHVLTAAHCVQRSIDMGYFAGPVTVEVGSTRLGAGKSYKVKRISYLRGFTFYSEKFLPNDISVVHLTEPVQTSDKVAVISLPEPNYSIPVGSKVTTSGFGLDDMQFGKMSPVLKKMDAKIVSHAKCQQPNIPRIHVGKICAANGPGYGTCKGDSGGPLVDKTKKILIGIVSGGDAKCNKGTPDVYTEVSRFLSYIKEELAWKSGTDSQNPAIDLENESVENPLESPSQSPSQCSCSCSWPPQLPSTPLKPHPEKPLKPLNPWNPQQPLYPWNPWKPNLEEPLSPLTPSPQEPSNPLYPDLQQPSNPLNPWNPQQPLYPWNPWKPYPQEPTNPLTPSPEQPLNPLNPYPQIPLNPLNPYPQLPLNPLNPYPQNPLIPLYPQNPLNPYPQQPLDPSDPEVQESISA